MSFAVKALICAILGHRIIRGSAGNAWQCLRCGKQNKGGFWHALPNDGDVLSTTGIITDSEIRGLKAEWERRYSGRARRLVPSPIKGDQMAAKKNPKRNGNGKKPKK